MHSTPDKLLLSSKNLTWLCRTYVWTVSIALRILQIFFFCLILKTVSSASQSSPIWMNAQKPICQDVDRREEILQLQRKQPRLEPAEAVFYSVDYPVCLKVPTSLWWSHQRLSVAYCTALMRLPASVIMHHRIADVSMNKMSTWFSFNRKKIWLLNNYWIIGN